ncbi:hypothetical protein HDU85_001444 [Gaertneriomyces sp. JEL0708]|nr:hypothetical protein HDU85_001444 [Gaertneriomyces sp. JEL0708]
MRATFRSLGLLIRGTPRPSPRPIARCPLPQGRFTHSSSHGHDHGSSSTFFGARRAAVFGVGLGAVCMVAISSYGKHIYADAPIAIEENGTFQEPSTKRLIAKVINVGGQKLQLLGAGVRQVSDICALAAYMSACSLIAPMRLQVTFVKLNVYTVSIYGPQSLFSYIRSSPLWKSFTGAEFAKKPEQDMVTNPYISDLVRNASTLVVHIRPTRVTDGAHIRNGILRFLTKKLAVEDAKGTVTDTQKHEIESAFDELRAVLPSSRKIGKDDVLSFTLARDGLKVEGVGVSGHVKNRWVAERFFESYLEGAISPSLKANVAATLEAALRN